MLCQLLELLCLQHREWLPLAPFSPTHQVVTPATVPSKYGLNDTDSSRVYPCLETKCLACKANASNCSACDLAASVIPQPVRCTSDLRLFHLLLLQATESTRLTSVGFLPFVPTRTASAVAANISNCLHCATHLANGVPLNSYASVPACIAPGAVPSGYGLNSTDPTRIPCVDAH